eukprot:CAMPEP_0168534414 /NCGR_PEP_ID=MMETSP0405-20121227/17897_1 /TAXON_ID=498012 /ORGANISM="Trichosphaerium sp, Strain Am-I-7 wt" /LENGTH=51 /DNA_ID=CAMNT_0008561139 /DNA_START=1 /DNA_END=152 /DNA_ORIENTATION=+
MSIRNSERVMLDIPDYIGHELVKRLYDMLPPVLECEGDSWERVALGEGMAG